MREVNTRSLVLSIPLILVVGCGGGSGSPRGASGGAGGNGSGAGGTAAGSGGSPGSSGGAGGAGSTAIGYACSSMLAPNANITSFADATAMGRWGTAPTTFTGGTFTYAAAGGAFRGSVDLAAHNFHMTGPLTGYAGAGLYFDLCTDVSNYRGVQFTIAGDLGTCALELQVQTNSDKPIENNGMKGTCSTGCTYPAVKNLNTMITGAGPTTLMVLFANLSGGTPVSFSKTEVVGLQWQLTSTTSCTPDVTVDDVVWIPN